MPSSKKSLFVIKSIEKKTKRNKMYRNVAFSNKMQYVYMSLKPNEEIEWEIHRTTDQFIRVEEGSCIVKTKNKYTTLKKDDGCIIPAGTRHFVKNKSKTKHCKLYTIYSSKVHPKRHFKMQNKK